MKIYLTCLLIALIIILIFIEGKMTKRKIKNIINAVLFFSILLFVGFMEIGFIIFIIRKLLETIPVLGIMSLVATILVVITNIKNIAKRELKVRER